MNIKKFVLSVLSAATVVALTACSPSSDDRAGINIVGSSTVYPFSIAVAELFSYESDYLAPKVESTGSGGGIKLFCAGIDLNTPSIVNASRRMKKSEQDKCAANGVDQMLEVKIGYDGLIFAQSTSAGLVNLTQRHIFLAMARDIPDSSGAMVPNPHQKWSDINSNLPKTNIRIYGPPPTSGTRDAFVELVMERGCATFPTLSALKRSDKKKFKALCHAIREDGVFVESGENDNLIIQKINSNPESFGIFGYSFLEENRDKVRGAYIDTVLPTFKNIASGDYPISRPLFFYVKMSHYDQIPGLEAFTRFFTSGAIMGSTGELSKRGLVPLPQSEYEGIVRSVKNRTPMSQL